MPAPKALAVRPTVSTAEPAPTKQRPEATSSAQSLTVPSNAAVVAALVAGGGPVTGVGRGGPMTGPPLPGRPAPGAQDMFGNSAVAAAGHGEAGAAPVAATVAPPEAAAAPPARGAEAEAPVAPGAGPEVKVRPG
ncbi:hypothetical protein ACWD35_44095, partial [Streptomyces sp. NPDC002671]